MSGIRHLSWYLFSDFIVSGPKTPDIHPPDTPARTPIAAVFLLGPYPNRRRRGYCPIMTTIPIHTDIYRVSHTVVRHHSDQSVSNNDDNSYNSNNVVRPVLLRRPPCKSTPLSYLFVNKGALPGVVLLYCNFTRRQKARTSRSVK